MKKEEVSLTAEQMAANESSFNAIIETTGLLKREGVPGLLKWLKGTDFVTAPASTKYHESYAGGLLEHSLKVYNVASQMNELYAAKGIIERVPESSLALMSLFHDICKVNFYKMSSRNVKNDDTGKWESVPFFSVEDPFPYGHGEKSVWLIERFVRLTPTEAIAIRWHMGGFDESVRGGSFAEGNAYNKYPIAALLHSADFQATYL